MRIRLMRQLVLALLVVTISAYAVQAQQTSLGIKGSRLGVGVSYEYFFADNQSVGSSVAITPFKINLYTLSASYRLYAFGTANSINPFIGVDVSTTFAQSTLLMFGVGVTPGVRIDISRGFISIDYSIQYLDGDIVTAPKLGFGLTF